MPRPLDPQAPPETTCRILSNGALRVLFSARGSGCVAYARQALTPWSGDRLADPDGFFVYLRDLETGRFWGLGQVGSRSEEAARRAEWEPGVFALGCRVQDLDARLDVCVAPDAAAALFRLSVEDRSGQHRRLEITTCAEVVLADPAAHAAHPAFAKLFVQTEAEPGARALLARRRPRSRGEQPPWLVHAWGCEQAVTWETDRTRFVGRGRSMAAPEALVGGAPLSGTTGNVLDPVVALRAALEIEPRGRVETAWLLGAGADRADVLALARRFGVARELESAFAAARLAAGRELNQLGLTPAEAETAHGLAGAMLYGSPALRAPSPVLARAGGWTARLSQLGLGPQRALAVLHAEHPAGLEKLPLLLRAHALWASMGLPIDLVVLCGEEVPPGLAAGALAPATVADAAAGSGRVMVLHAAALQPEDRDALDAAARLVVYDAIPLLESRLTTSSSADGPPLRHPAAAPAPPAPRPSGRPFASGTQAAGAGFAPGGQEYVVPVQLEGGVLRLPPRPWINVVANERFGFLVSETGAGTTWSRNSREHRLTPWSNDALLDPHGEAFYARDEDTGEFWSLFPGPAPAAARYEVRHGWGRSLCRHRNGDLEQEIRLFVPRRDPLRVARVQLVNHGRAPRRLSLFAYAQLVLGSLPEESGRFVVTKAELASGVLFGRSAFAAEYRDGVAFAAVAIAASPATVHWTADRAAFLGPEGTLAQPAALQRGAVLGGHTGAGLEPCFAHQVTLTLEAGATAEVAFLLGEGSGEAEARALAARYASPGAIDSAEREAVGYWHDLVTGIQVRTPVPAIDLMVNGWLAYQTLACRIWARSAFYQSGGAFGFRDQLQDASALVALAPELVREQILLHAAHQFVEGDVLHWWHPPLGRGLRTRFADDLLWLPYLTAAYVGATGDESVLDEPVRFLVARALVPGEDEAYLLPAVADGAADLYEHCCRAIDRALVCGAHGLPLFGSGDWNDGMNRVGHGGRGESVWMGFFLYAVLGDFAPLGVRRGDTARLRRYAAHRTALSAALETAGWDGAWYRRGYYDDGTPLGSAGSDECRIDALAQAWAVLSGAAPAARAEAAMDAVEWHLVSEAEGIIRLLTPPFEHTAQDPGYIKGYVPGVRENGGQYTHAAMWVVRALAALGRNERVAPLLAMLSPVSHTRTPAQLAVYQVEPYVVAADVYGAPPHVGRGGWTWYTGSSGWMLRVALESLLGFTLHEGKEIRLAPCVPDEWPEFTLAYRVPGEETRYELTARNPHQSGRGVRSVSLDGVPLRAEAGVARLPLLHDGRVHRAEIVLGGGAAAVPG